MQIKLLALGKAGGNISNVLSKYVDGVFYVNTHREELAKFNGKFYYPEESGKEFNKLLIDGRGTGRSPQAGTKLAIMSEKLILKFLKNAFKKYKGIIIIIIGGGGGTGTGFAPVVVRLLSNMGAKLGVVYTLPLENEGMPTLPNALNGFKSLNKSFELHKVSPFFIIDNQLQFNEVEGGLAGDFWEEINNKIANILKFVTLISEKTIDIGSFNTLDEREILRILRLTKENGKIGYNDIKSFTFSSDIETFTREFYRGALKDSNETTVSGYNYRTAEGVLIIIEQPKSLDKKIGNSLVNDIFTVVSKQYRKARMLKSVISSDESFFKITILFSGLTMPKRIDRIKKLTERIIKSSKNIEYKEIEVGVDFDDDFINEM